MKVRLPSHSDRIADISEVPSRARSGHPQGSSEGVTYVAAKHMMYLASPGHMQNGERDFELQLGSVYERDGRCPVRIRYSDA
jgi:hypothetical protein